MASRRICSPLPLALTLVLLAGCRRSPPADRRPRPEVALAMKSLAGEFFTKMQASSIETNRTVFGRYLVAVGTNEKAVRLAGIHTRRLRVAAFALAGVWPDSRRSFTRPGWLRPIRTPALDSS